MPVEISEHNIDPDDPGGAFRRLTQPGSGAVAELDAPSPWAAPDYSTITPDHELDGPGPHRAWPGPPLVMPAGLLPDGLPYGGDDMDNAARIGGVMPRSEVEADACVRAYERQQRLLRREAGLDLPRRVAPSFRIEDVPATYVAIVELHRCERLRRQRLAG